MAKGRFYVSPTYAQEASIDALFESYTVRTVLIEPKIAVEITNIHKQRVVITMDADGVIHAVELEQD